MATSPRKARSADRETRNDSRGMFQKRIFLRWSAQPAKAGPVKGITSVRKVEIFEMLFGGATDDSDRGAFRRPSLPWPLGEPLALADTFIAQWSRTLFDGCAKTPAKRREIWRLA